MNALCVIDESPQGTPAWHAARLGRLTGSRAAAMLSTIKSGGEAAGRRNLRTALVLERLTGQPADPYDYLSRDMLHGQDLEPEAREVYEAVTGLSVRQTGFIARTDLMVGCSLDGDIDPLQGGGIVELKCPKPGTHLRFLRLGLLPSEHAPQVTHNLFVTSAPWCDFVSYNPTFPFELQLAVVRVQASQINLTAYEGLARLFLHEVDAEQDELLTMLAARRL